MKKCDQPKLAQSKTDKQQERLLLRQVPFRTIIGTVLIACVIACYAYGIFAPFLELDKFWVFKNTVSLYSSISALFVTHNYLLGLILLVFSICVPMLKLIMLMYVSIFANPAHGAKVLSMIESIGKWAMLDVFIVAIILVSVKLGGVATVTIHIGVIYFAIAVLATSVLIHYFNWLCQIAVKKIQN